MRSRHISALPLMEKVGSPIDQPVDLAVVEMDGGRLQILDRRDAAALSSQDEAQTHERAFRMRKTTRGTTSWPLAGRQDRRVDDDDQRGLGHRSLPGDPGAFRGSDADSQAGARDQVGRVRSRAG